MKTHISYIIFEVSPCKLGDKYRSVLELYNEKDALKFIKTWNMAYDFNYTCLKLMKVLI